MPTTADVFAAPRGPCMDFYIAIKTLNQNGTTNTEEYSIGYLAKVKFQFNYANRTHQVKISIKQENIDEDINVKMDITCTFLNYYKQFVCSENWLEYMDMGDIHSNQEYVNNTLTDTSKIEIGIIVNKFITIESRMAKMYEDTDLTDFFLSAPDGRVPLHKACLGAHSDVFRAMLTTKWKETEEGCIELKNVTVKTLQHLKAYMYLGTVPDDEFDELYPLLLLASQYMIQDLQDQCVTNLARLVKPDKLQCLMDFAVDNKITDIIIAMAQLIPSHIVAGAREIKKN